MKLFLTTILIFSFNLFAKETPTIVGKIVKVKHEKEGTNYFITYKREGKELAFPISPDSKVRNLNKYIGETVKVYGETSFVKSDRSEMSYIMHFKINKITGLSLKDLQYIPKLSKEDEVKYYLSKQRGAVSPGVKINNIDDKTANRIIFIGGAILAAEVLGTILK